MRESARGCPSNRSCRLCPCSKYRQNHASSARAAPACVYPPSRSARASSALRAWQSGAKSSALATRVSSLASDESDFCSSVLARSRTDSRTPEVVAKSKAMSAPRAPNFAQGQEAGFGSVRLRGAPQDPHHFTVLGALRIHVDHALDAVDCCLEALRLGLLAGQGNADLGIAGEFLSQRLERRQAVR